VAAQLHILPEPDQLELEAPLPLVERGEYQSELLRAFLVSRRAVVSPTSVRTATSALRANLLPWLEAHGHYVWDVTPDVLDDWALSLKNSVKTRTHHHYFVQVQHFYDWLVKRRGEELQKRVGIRLVNPVDQFNRARRLPNDERLVPVPREEAISYFLAASRKEMEIASTDVKWLQACRNYALWMVLNWAGLRRMEVTALVRDDVDLVAGVLRVREGKGGKGRIVHIQPQLSTTLRWYLHEVRPQDPSGWRVPFIFLNNARQPFNVESIRNLLHHEEVEARLPREDQFTCHGLRRAYATRLYKTLREQRFRDPLVYVKEQLGHKYLSTTQRYCQLDDDYRYFLVQEAAEALVQHYSSRSEAGSQR